MKNGVESLEDRIKRHEPLRLTPYKDSDGRWRVGWGHRMIPGEHYVVLTRQEAQTLLNEDMAAARADVAREIPFAATLPPQVFNALVEMCLQRQIAGLMEFKEILGFAETRDFAGMSGAIINSMWEHEMPTCMQELAAIVGKCHQLEIQR